MSQHYNQGSFNPTGNVNYDPLPPGSTDDLHAHQSYYNTPQGTHSPAYGTPELPGDNYAIPSGAAQPRFLGAAMQQEPGHGTRNSYADSYGTHSFDQGSEYDSSIYGLNDHGQRSAMGSPAMQGYRDDPNDSFVGNERGMPMGNMQKGRYLEEKRAAYASPRSKRRVVILSVIAALILLILAVVIPLYFAVIKPKSEETKDADGDGKDDDTGKPVVAHIAVTGGDGSQVTLEDGSNMTYTNSYGGFWYWDENDPFNNNAKAQSWSPALNESFNYGVDRIRGVNLGGWLTLEPFISPAMYQPYQQAATPAIDEWTLHTHLRQDNAMDKLEDHYKTFITEKDFAEIAGAGLNYVRIPIPFWSVEVREGEPFLEGVAWTYLLKGIQWARKYGIRINLDLHALPGSQNGWNHSGKFGSVNMLNGPMGFANAQRSLDYIRIIAEFISQPEYKNVVIMFGFCNEIQGSIVGQDTLSAFYLQAYNIIRNAGGIGEGNGPMVTFHDAFFARESWNDRFPNADRMSLDSHPYIAFGGQSDAAMDTYANRPCEMWAQGFNESMSNFGMINAGEWSNAVTDCGLFLNGVNLGTRYEGNYTDPTDRVGSCEQWIDWESYDDKMKADLMNFNMASMDALQNWFFWTWKIGPSMISGKVESPAWSYQLGLENGWIPKDPRDAVGRCGNNNPFNGPLKSWQTGGAGAGDIPASVTQQFAWPPPSISNGGAVSNLPSYTPTGAIPTLPGPTFATSYATATPTVGSGWTNQNDNAGLMVDIPGCNYLDPWVGSAPPPSPLCG